MFAYGPCAGLRRFLDAFAAHRYASTFFMCGRAIERAPRLAASCRRPRPRTCPPRAGGGVRTPILVDAALERASLDRCIEVAHAALGERPLGFFCRGGQSAHTRDLIAELGFLYDSNGFDDDLPYFSPAGDGRMLVVPYALDCNDMKFFHPNGFVEPDQFVRYVRAALATLLDEACCGTAPGFLNLGFHLRICGAPRPRASPRQRYPRSARPAWATRLGGAPRRSRAPLARRRRVT